MKCRRCDTTIPEGDVAHLLPGPDASKHESTSIRSATVLIISCGDCLLPSEKGCMDAPGYVAEARRLRLAPAEKALLGLIGDGDVVYRRPQKVMVRLGDEPRVSDRNVSKTAYALISKRLAEWNVIPLPDRVRHGPTAWLQLTRLGHTFLEEEKHFAHTG